MARKPILAAVRDALATASNLLSLHSNNGKGEIGKAQKNIQSAKNEIENYVDRYGDEEYEDVFKR